MMPSAAGSSMTTLTGFRRMKDSSSCQDEAINSSGSSAKTCLTWASSRVGRNAATLTGRWRASYETGVKTSSAGGVSDKKSAVRDRKQTFYDKKTPFRHLQRALRCVFSSTTHYPLTFCQEILQ